MTAVDVVAVLLWLTLTTYAVTGGADFGGGAWDLLAGDAQRGMPRRRFIDESITPVWEANHVWLVIVLVFLWTGFPRAFEAIMSVLFVPLILVALGIVLRGSGFAFRKAVRHMRLQQLTGGIFASSCVITPFFMGAAAGAIATGRVRANGVGNRIASWTSPTCMVLGALSVVAFAYLAATYLTDEARRHDDDELRTYFARRALASGALTGVLGLVSLAELHHSAARTFDHLGRAGALALLVASAVLGLGALAVLALRRGRNARFLSAGAFATALWAWAVAQYPSILPGSLSLHAAAAPTASLVSEMVVFGAVVVLAGPSFVLLYVLSQRRLLEEE